MANLIIYNRAIQLLTWLMDVPVVRVQSNLC